MERLLIELVDGRGYSVHLESTGELLVERTSYPVTAGAKALLERGRDPMTPLTMRVRGRDHDAFVAAPVGDWARSTADTTWHPLRHAPWKPLPHEERAP